MAIDIIHEYFPGTMVEWEVRIVLYHLVFCKAQMLFAVIVEYVELCGFDTLTHYSSKIDPQRTARVAKPTMTVDETTSGDEIATFTQRDMSDDYRGPGVDELRAALQKFKDENS